MRNKSSHAARALIAIVCTLLLFAQQVGLTHSVWHAAESEPLYTAAVGVAHAGAEHQHERNGDAQRALCVYDGAFGVTLAGHLGAVLACIALAPDAARIALVSSGRTTVDVVPAASRGPPIFL